MEYLSLPEEIIVDIIMRKTMNQLQVLKPNVTWFPGSTTIYMYEFTQCGKRFLAQGIITKSIYRYYEEMFERIKNSFFNKPVHCQPPIRDDYWGWGFRL